MKPITSWEQAYDYALTRLSYRDFSENELKQVLMQHACQPEIIDAVLVKLKDYNLIDDSRYAHKVYSAWLSKKFYGANHLRMEFKKKNVKDEFANSILLDFSEDMELARAIEAARNWQKKNNKKYDLKQADVLAKMSRALMAKGFNGNIIRKALNRLGCDFAE
ncbi:MAG: regulatory protein RecX [Acidaminococcaceae bacterium]